MRMIISVVSAAIVTAGLLFLMSLFIKDKQDEVKESPPTVEIDDISIPKEKPEPQPEDIKPPQPPVIEPTPEQQGELIETAEIVQETDIMGVFDLELTDLSLPTGLGALLDMGLTQESAATPMFRAQPNYPVDAQMKGLEGWVLLKYDVDTSGSLSNISVVDSEPGKIFNKEAMRALKKWKFKPASSNGQAIASRGETVKIEFNMENH